MTQSTQTDTTIEITEEPINTRHNQAEENVKFYQRTANTNKHQENRKRKTDSRHSENKKENHQGDPVGDNINAQKGKVLFLTGRHGRNCGVTLQSLLKNKFSIRTISKPYASIKNILSSCQTEASSFTHNDYIVIWFNSVETITKEHIDILNKNKNTNIVLMTEPYRQFNNFNFNNNICSL